jgi:hypothetical protein
LEQTNLNAFYQVTEKLEGTGDDNCVTIKVVQEGRVKRVAETVGAVEIPVSTIKNAINFNPYTREYHPYHSTTVRHHAASACTPVSISTAAFDSFMCC